MPLLGILCLLSSGYAEAKEPAVAGWGNDRAQMFKLKPGADGKLCLKCHVQFNEKMAKTFVHTPLKKFECTGCHNAHSANHGKLVAADTKGKGVCYTCHGSMLPSSAVSTHKVVAEGNCTKCHDPHSAPYKNNLVAGGNQLCVTCHKEYGEPLAKLKYSHKPVRENCLNCHDAHGSAKAKSLLKANVTELCISCHKTDVPLFLKRHQGYPVAKARCTGCHDPHGSNVPGIIYDVVHRPVMSKMCNQCHSNATDPNPLKLKKEGNELCQGCHNTMFNKMAGSSRYHWPIFTKEGCLTCHNPHAAKVKSLLRAPMVVLCGKCHADSINRQVKSKDKHEPIMKGQCTNCHDPHSSNNLFLTKQKYDFDLCATCHDWSKHSKHPIGAKTHDPRNKNVAIGCTSCHRSHGTENMKMFYVPTTSETCLMCHEEFKR